MTAHERHLVRGLGLSGDGVVETAHGPVYVPGALPDDEVRQAADGQWVIEVANSPDRRASPLCPHVARCGGCSVQHMGDHLYRRWKARLLPDALRAHGLSIEVRPMIEAQLHSRRRAVLAARREAGQVVLGFHGLRSHAIEPLEDCAVLVPAIVAGLPGLRAAASVLLDRAGEARISAIATDHGLDVDFEGERLPLNASDRSAIAGLSARHGIARLSLKGDVLVERARPSLKIAGIDVVAPPGAFLQATGEAEAAMQGIAAAALEKPKAKRVADLFSGVGTFSFEFARRAKVMAIDADRALIGALEAARRAAQGLKPIETKVRDLFQHPLSPKELESFDAVLFDPPRAGAKAQAEALARSKVRTVIAVSCNPATLARDLKALIGGGYQVESLTPVDQFLFTPHLEAIAVLRR